MNTATVKIATEYSRVPAGRFLTDGPYSGEKFRDEKLVPLLKEHDRVIVDFDDTEGYGSSFLEEVFGGLIRNQIFNKQELLNKLEFRATGPYEFYLLEVQKYIQDSEPESINLLHKKPAN